MAQVLESAKSDLLKASNTDLLPLHRVTAADSTSASRTRLEEKLPQSEQSTRNTRQLHSEMKDSHLSDRLDPTSRTKNASSSQLPHLMDVISTPTVGAVNSDSDDDVERLPLLLPDDPFCETDFSRDMNKVFPQPSAPNTNTSFITFVTVQLPLQEYDDTKVNTAVNSHWQWVTSNATVAGSNDLHDKLYSSIFKFLSH